MEVLVIEDNELNLQLLQAILAANKITYDFATAGTEGVRKALQHPYAVILMDLQLPDIDGFTALTQIRSVSPVPVIAITGNATVSDEVRANAAGFHTFIRKPYRIDDLLDAIRPFLR